MYRAKLGTLSKLFGGKVDENDVFLIGISIFHLNFSAGSKIEENPTISQFFECKFQILNKNLALVRGKLFSVYASIISFSFTYIYLFFKIGANSMRSISPEKFETPTLFQNLPYIRKFNFL